MRRDPLLALLAGKSDLQGQQRQQERDRGKPLAGKSTLNRLERTTDGLDRYKKIRCASEAIDRLLVEVFVEAHPQEPAEIILDIDATDTPLHGQQEGRFFHGYYGHYCYLPLYIFSGQHVLCARQRVSNQDAAAGSVAELKRIVAQIRDVWPQVRIIVRGDSGFCRDELLSWCEANGVDYVVGLARNERLRSLIEEALEQAASKQQQTGRPARVFSEFGYQTQQSWSRALRRLGLKGTRWARAQTETIRRGLLKIGAQVKVSVRRVYLSLAAGYPDEEAFAAVYRALRPPG